MKVVGRGFSQHVCTLACFLRKFHADAQLKVVNKIGSYQQKQQVIARPSTADVKWILEWSEGRCAPGIRHSDLARREHQFETSFFAYNPLMSAAADLSAMLFFKILFELQNF
jgi:hypothetical protein